MSSEANEICNRQLKKTILPEHVFQALQVMFIDYNKVACHTQTTNKSPGFHCSLQLAYNFHKNIYIYIFYFKLGFGEHMLKYDLQ